MWWRGARGGSTWAGGPADPAKGFLYLNTQDWPTIYKLSLEDPLSKRTRAGSREGSVYQKRCGGCHEKNGVRGGAGPPPLAGIGQRLSLESFRLTVHSGRG